MIEYISNSHVHDDGGDGDACVCHLQSQVLCRRCLSQSGMTEEPAAQHESLYSSHLTGGQERRMLGGGAGLF